MPHRNSLSIGFQLRHRAQHCTIILYKHRFYSNTTYQCCTHINIASISLYCDLLSIRSLDTTLIQKILFYATSFPRRFHATPTTLERCAPPCHNTACFVTARLAVQLNGIVQNHSTCRFVVTTQLHFH